MTLVADALAAQWNRPDNLYGAASSDRQDKANGRDAAAHRVHELLKQGFIYVGTADIKNAFGSVDLEALYQVGSKLPLPTNTIRTVLDARNFNFTEVPYSGGSTNQTKHAGPNDPGEEYAWLEYTLGLWDEEGTGNLVGDPNLDGFNRRIAQSQAEQERSSADTRTGDKEVHYRGIQNSDPNSQAAETDNSHVRTGREGADTRSQGVGEELYQSSIPGSYNTPTDTDPIQSATCPYGLPQGSATSPIIFAMLLGELPNATDDARFLVCHDDVIVLAKTPEARSSLINTLRDYFANRCLAGSLTMEAKVQVDHESFEWLGYSFDPAHMFSPTGGIGVGQRVYNNLVGRLIQAEADDIADLEKYGHNLASARPCGYPLRVWHTLKRWRSGCGAVHPQHSDLQELLDYGSSGWVAARYASVLRNPIAVRLNDAVFSTAAFPGNSTASDRLFLRNTLKNYHWECG